jgi:ProQ/FINO family
MPKVPVLPLLTALAAAFPNAFSLHEGRRRPLKIGIHHDLLVLGGAERSRELSAALRSYTLNRAYLRAMRPGAVRVDLDGNPAGRVTDEDAARARDACRHRGEATGAGGSEEGISIAMSSSPNKKPFPYLLQQGHVALADRDARAAAARERLQQAGALNPGSGSPSRNTAHGRHLPSALWRPEHASLFSTNVDSDNGANELATNIGAGKVFDDAQDDDRMTARRATTHKWAPEKQTAERPAANLRKNHIAYTV